MQETDQGTLQVKGDVRETGLVYTTNENCLFVSAIAPPSGNSSAD
jgi:hypothetical protein